MNDIRFYADEQVAKAVATGMRLRGIDMMTAVEAGMLGRSDEEQLAFAISQWRVIFTQDRDFLKLAAQGRSHLGIVYAPQNTAIGHVVPEARFQHDVRGLLQVHHSLTAAEMIDRVEFICAAAATRLTSVRTGARCRCV